MLFVLFLAAALTGWNLAVNLAPVPAWTYVPGNVAATAVLLAVARSAGLSWRDIGLGREGAAPGLRWGLGITAIVAVGLALALVLPAAGRFLDDARVAGISGGVLAYRVLLRIPLGTVLLEEVAFRGVLLAAWARWQGARAAVIGSSVLFGLWHIGPMVGLLDANEYAEHPVLVVAGIIAGVVGTAVAGLGFCWLRVRTRGLVGPIIVHTGLNGLATVAAFTFQRLA